MSLWQYLATVAFVLTLVDSLLLNFVGLLRVAE